MSVPPPLPPPEVYSPKRYARATMIKDNRRLVESMIERHAGGADGMNLLDVSGYSNETDSAIWAYHNARDPGELPYVVNPDLWCAELLPEMTCLVIHKDDCGTGWAAAGQAWRARFGGVAITPRHVLYCKHAFTHAQGTWGLNGNTSNTPPTRLRFLDEDGLTVDRIQLHQAPHATLDLCVAVMDEYLPDSIRPAPIMPRLDVAEWAAMYSIALCQEWGPGAAANQSPTYTPNSDYPVHHRQMLYLASVPWGPLGAPDGDRRLEFLYAVWPGDSGTPILMPAGGRCALCGLVGATSLWDLPDAVGTLNGLIAAADAAAISLGRLDEPTGLQASYLENIHL